MNSEEFKNLGSGDIVRHKSSKEPMMITGNYGNRCTAVQTKDLMNADEWDLIRKAEYPPAQWRKLGPEHDLMIDKQTTRAFVK